jgi:hypothetical protein
MQYQQIKDCEPGQVVTIEAVVIGQNGSTTLCWAPGIGGSGQWAVTNGIQVEPHGDPLSPLQVEALQALAAAASVAPR